MARFDDSQRAANRRAALACAVEFCLGTQIHTVTEAEVLARAERFLDWLNDRSREQAVA